MASLLGAAIVVLLVAVAGFLVGRSSDDRQAPSAAGSGTAAARGEGFAVLRVRMCPTKLSVPQSFVRVGPRLSVPLPSGAEEKLSVYASTVGSLLIGPVDWECKATMGVDGTELIGISPPGSTRPAWYAREGEAAVTASIVPGCAGCIAEMICGFFPQEEVVRAYADVEECPPIPSPEQISHVGRSTAVFVDPAGVKGTGTGSGGSLPSLGAVTYGRESGAMKISCTVPADTGNVCPSIVGATLALRG